MATNPPSQDQPDDPFGDELAIPLEAYEDDFDSGLASASVDLTPNDWAAQQQARPGEPPPESDYPGFQAESSVSSTTSTAFDEMQAKRKEERAALFARLNERQAQAVFGPQSGALVLAGAGSGKTSVLTARVTHLVTAANPPLPPRSVLAVTFTNKAAAEMRGRLLKMLDRVAVNQLWIGTFHSLCNRLLRENAEAAGLPKTFAILDVDGQEALCRGILKDLGLTRATVKAAQEQREAARQGDLLAATDAARPTPLAAAGAITAQEAEEAGLKDGGDSGEFLTPAKCVQYISSRKEALQEPDPPRQAPSVHSSPIQQLEAVFAEYQVRCGRSSLLDFQDLLTRAVKLLEIRKDVRDAMRSRFKAILVDEFQDTNEIQYRWLQLLKGPDAHVMAVGDDDQSIYAFRGAKPENMARFLTDLGAPKGGGTGALIRLEHNYRSLPYILDVANGVIARNANRLGKTLRTSQADRGERVDLVHYARGSYEAASIAQEIQHLVRMQGVQPNEIAVLYRSNQQSSLFESELNKLGLPVTVYGGFRFYARQEVKYVMSYLDLVQDLDHDISFMKVANFPPRGLGDRTLEELRQDAQLRTKTMMEMVAERAKWREESPGSFGGTAAINKQLKLEAFVGTVMSLAERAESMPLHKLIETVIEDTGLKAHYEAEDAEGGGGPKKKANKTDKSQGTRAGVTKEGSKATGKDAEEAVGERLANLQEIVSAARQFILDNPEFEAEDTLTQLSEYLAHVALMTSTSESDMNSKKTISLMTVHSSKGLEFDHVYVTGLEERNFPHARSIEEDLARDPRDETPNALAALGAGGGGTTPPAKPGVEGSFRDGPGVEEERRLMYVAVTRARKVLKLSHCSQRLVNGDVRVFDPSRFLFDLPTHRVRMVEGHAAQAQQRVFGAASSPGTPATANPYRASPNPFVSAATVATVHAPASASLPAGSQPRGEGRIVAVIGTAGRSKETDEQLTAPVWEAMVEHARDFTTPHDILMSGGAAWADHVAVRLFLDGHVSALRLHLPAPLGAMGFEGPAYGSAGSAANYYHRLFREATGVDGLAEIAEALRRGASVTTEPSAAGYGGMERRNQKVARGCTHLLAYTWSESGEPNDGGTQRTWNLARQAKRVHAGLKELCAAPEESELSERRVLEQQRG